MRSTVTTNRYRAVFLLVITLIAPACGSLSDEKRWVRQVEFNSSGDLLLSTFELGPDGYLASFDAEIKKQRFSFGYAGAGRQGLDVSNEGQVGAVVSGTSVIVFDTQLGSWTFRLGPRELDFYSDLAGLVVDDVEVSPNGHYVAVVSTEHAGPPALGSSSQSQISIFRTATRERLWQRSYQIRNLGPTFAADSQRLTLETSTSVDSAFEIVEVETGLSVRTFSIASTNVPFAISDGQSVLLGFRRGPSGLERFPTLWSATDGALIQQYSFLGDECTTVGFVLAVSRDAQLFASESYSACGELAGKREVVVWNRQGQVLHRFPAQHVSSLAFSPDNSKLAVGMVADGAAVYQLSDGVRIGHRTFTEKLF